MNEAMETWGRLGGAFTVRQEARVLGRGVTLADFHVDRIVQAAVLRVDYRGQEWGAEQRLK